MCRLQTDMDTRLILHIAAALLAGVCPPVARAEPSCTVDEALREYTAVQAEDPGMQATVRDIIAYVGVDVSGTLDLCAFLESPAEKSIESLSRNVNRNYEVSGPATSLAYFTFIHQIRQDITTSNTDALLAQNLLDFYDATGFPYFPLKASKEALRREVARLEPEAAFIVFKSGVDGRYGELKAEFLVDALTDADSLDDFVRSLNDVPHSFYEVIPSDLENEVAYRNAAFEKSMNVCEKAVKVESVFEAAGLMELPRGLMNMSSCDFLADDVLHLLRLTLEMYGEHSLSVKALARSYLGLNLDDDVAVRELVCELARVSSQQDVVELFQDVPWEIATNTYTEYAGLLLRAVVEPQSFINSITEMVTYMNMAKKVGYPDFPLKLTDEQAMEIARVLITRFGHHDHEVYTAEDIKSAQSSGDLRRRFFNNAWYLTSLHYAVETLDGKVETLYDIFFSAMRVVRRLDSYGLLMLPKY